MYSSTARRSLIERLWRSLKYEAVYLHELTSGLEARGIIGAWIAFYNDERPHTALGRTTPPEAHGRLIDTPQNREFSTALATGAGA